MNLPVGVVVSRFRSRIASGHPFASARCEVEHVAGGPPQPAEAGDDQHRGGAVVEVSERLGHRRALVGGDGAADPASTATVTGSYPIATAKAEHRSRCALIPSPESAWWSLKIAPRGLFHQGSPLKPPH